jgi:hypothetical protein
MTWVVGSPTLWGYGFGLSDIRVTLGNGVEVDCLQKIYPVGRYVAAGFAGDVEIGFRMVDELRRLADLRDERVSCDPHAIEKEWPRYAQQIFARFPDENRAGGCDLMIISAHPREHNGNPAWARSYVQIFRSPTFETDTVKVHTLGSIGCGLVTGLVEKRLRGSPTTTGVAISLRKAKWAPQAAWEQCSGSTSRICLCERAPRA